MNLLFLGEFPERIFPSAVDPLCAQFDPVSVDGEALDPSADPVLSLQNDHVVHVVGGQCVGGVQAWDRCYDFSKYFAEKFG
jgi:hypothetical protein